ncbi:MAG: fimbrial biogenesis chaperone [Gammaproteobacteria bacterium]
MKTQGDVATHVMKLRGILLFLVLAAPLWAQAGSFEVNPIGMTLSAAHTTGVITVTNNSDSPTVVQLQIVAWSQENGEDVYTASRKLLATPPIFTVPAGGQQTVRLGVMTKPDAQRESAYRLFLQEVPPPKTLGFQGLQVLLRIGIPVFVKPGVATAPDLHWSARQLSATELSVEAANDGSAHAHIGKLTLGKSLNGAALSEQPGGYVLPGARHIWKFKLAKPLAADTPLTITAETDRGTLHAQLVRGK